MKRKWFGLVLLGLGGFLLVAGVLASTWAPGMVKKTPEKVEQTTYLEGTVQKLDASTGELGAVTPVKVRSVTLTDTDVSDNEVVAWSQNTCVWMDVDDAPECPEAVSADEPDPRVVSISTDVFATDRVNALAVNDDEYLPADATPHDGLVNKWPFDSEQKDYVYWDGTMGQGVPAVYDRTETLEGVDAYVYVVTISDASIEVADGVPGTYDNVVEIWVEPKTGAIQQQTQDQQRYLEDGTQVLDLKIGFTEEQIDDFADDAKGNILLLDLVTLWVPIVGFAGGGLCLLAGLALLLTARKRDGAPQHEKVGAAS